MAGVRGKRAERSSAVRDRLSKGLELLESRQLLTLPPGSYHFYRPFAPQRVVDPSTPGIGVAHPIGSNPRVLARLGNDGRTIRGTDLRGDQWQIQIHGPGDVIVTDATPNDGVLESEIGTIQLIGTDPNRTYVTGQVTASSRVVSDGTIGFNHLIATNGVKSIILNGFTLARTVDQPGTIPLNHQPEIFLPGGVGLLQFHNIDAPIDLATNDPPFVIQIGSANSPLTQTPIIRLDSIFNTVFDSSQQFNINGTPRTNPTVQINVNGDIKSLSFISSTATPVPAGFEYEFPTVGTTGRTAIRATGIHHLKVVGTARNVTASKAAIPFQNGFSGLNHLDGATFGGNADAVGLDVKGKVGRLRFLHGLGSPVGAQTGAINLGVPDPERGYPSFGLLGGLVRARKIHAIQAGPANLILQTSSNPDYIQQHRQGTTTFYSRPGNALTSAAIVSDGSIRKVHIVGNAQNSEIKTGFNYASYAAGLEGTRSPSRISRLKQRGDLVDSVTSATYRPGSSNVYGLVNSDGTTTNQAGPGRIHGRFVGRLYTAGGETALHNQGRGFFARHKRGYLPPPEAPTRTHNVLTNN